MIQEGRRLSSLPFDLDTRVSDYWPAQSVDFGENVGDVSQATIDREREGVKAVAQYLKMHQ